MVSPAQLRKLALALPEAEEQDHHGFPSFRVRGKIFATLPSAGQLNVFIALDEVAAVVELVPKVCEPLLWGKKLSGLKVNLAAAKSELVNRLLRAAWTLKAPRSLLPKKE